ncbi:hypothetical protein C7212DRAFT_345656 [Tuber magnatum]|uniref:Uncharacterized protein n=1 Tax=Tuber magnatum TaxID=42249 RepID=A0A317SKV7_9PEZI|nr:hypothetical protein C7212DRAFT_345656 [Tuber magnatum]
MCCILLIIPFEAETGEHYSLVQNRERLHTGLSNLSPLWIVEVVISSLLCPVDSQKIQEVWGKAKGNINAAVFKDVGHEEGGPEEGEEERIKETEAEKADAQGFSETQDSTDKVNNLVVDTNSVKAAKRSALKIGA